MKRLIGLIIILLISITCFAYTITYLGTSDTIPVVLQGTWTEIAVSKNKGETWIDGYSQIKITSTGLSIETEDGRLSLTVERVNSYKDDQGYKGYTITIAGAPCLLEFWFLDEHNIMMLLQTDRVESMRGRLRR